MTLLRELRPSKPWITNTSVISPRKSLERLFSEAFIQGLSIRQLNMMTLPRRVICSRRRTGGSTGGSTCRKRWTLYHQSISFGWAWSWTFTGLQRKHRTMCSRRPWRIWRKMNILWLEARRWRSDPLSYRLTICLSYGTNRNTSILFLAFFDLIISTYTKYLPS